MTRRFAVIAFATSTRLSAQIENGDFETGALPPWTVIPTNEGGTLVTGVVAHDIDGPGPLPPSPAARFMVGRTAPGSGAAGITLRQNVTFPPIERTYRLTVDWSVQCMVNVNSQTGGVFELLFNDSVVAQAIAPVTVQGQSSYGRLEAEISTGSSVVHPVAVRILRPTLLGEEVFQCIDNVTLTLITCYTNCDGSLGTPRLTANDLLCFLNKFAAGDSYANCDASHAPPQLDANDFLCFLMKYAAGCS